MTSCHIFYHKTSSEFKTPFHRDVDVKKELDLTLHDPLVDVLTRPVRGGQVSVRTNKKSHDRHRGAFRGRGNNLSVIR